MAENCALGAGVALNVRDLAYPFFATIVIQGNAIKKMRECFVRGFTKTNIIKKGMLRRCTRCKETKSESEFYKKVSQGPRSFQILCKRCNNEYSNERLYKLPATKRREIWLKQSRKSKKRYPEKSNARKLVREAIRKKELERLPCEECSETETQAHHDDYSKPLQVRWLCHKHHRAVHYPELYSLE